MGRVFFGGGKPAMEAPSGGILASDLAVGSTVNLMVNGTATEFIVVDQGIPSDSSAYDSSCNGTWLMMKDLYELREFDSGAQNYFLWSRIKTYLNGDFFKLFGSVEQNIIKPVKVPCWGDDEATDEERTVKVFLPSAIEVGLPVNTAYWPTEGAKFDYFTLGDTSAAHNKRLAYLDGIAREWWVRSKANFDSTSCIVIMYEFSSYSWGGRGTTSNCGIRPMVVVPSNALFDPEAMLLKGVA